MILHNSKSRPVSAGKDPVGTMEYYPNLRSVQSGHTSKTILHSCFRYLATGHPPSHGSGVHQRPAPTGAATIGLTPRQRPGSFNPMSHLVVVLSFLGAQPRTAHLLNHLACGTIRGRLGRGRSWRIRRLFSNEPVRGGAEALLRSRWRPTINVTSLLRTRGNKLRGTSRYCLLLGDAARFVCTYWYRYIRTCLMWLRWHRFLGQPVE